MTSSAYWAFGIPLAWLFGLHLEEGIKGLWYGPLAACAYLTVMYNILILCINWPSLYVEIVERRDVEKAESARILAEELAASELKDKNDAANGDDFERAEK